MLRLKQYSKRTEEGYVQWYKRYVLFQAQVTGRMKHPQEMGAAEVSAFLTHLAVNKKLAASSQNQALNALVFLYREVLKVELAGIDAVRAKRQQHLPVVLTQDEVKTLLAGVKGDAGLAVKLLYGCGLRVAEVLALRVQNVASRLRHPRAPSLRKTLSASFSMRPVQGHIFRSTTAPGA